MIEKEYFDLCIERGYKYDPNTGFVYGSKGIPLLRKSNRGYYRFCIRITKGQKSILCHRFAWYYTYKSIPNIIDHIDGNGLNNKIENLRNVTNSINCLNRIKCGYSYNKYHRKWAVTFKKKYICEFDSEEDAKQFSKNYKIEYFKSIGLDYIR